MHAGLLVDNIRNNQSLYIVVQNHRPNYMPRVVACIEKHRYTFDHQSPHSIVRMWHIISHNLISREMKLILRARRAKL